MTRKVLRCVRKKKSVFRKYPDKGHPAVKRANLEATNELKKAKQKFEKKLADNIKHDTKSFYAYARNKSKTKTQIGTLVSDNGISLNSDKDIAGYFNRYFSSVFTMEDNLNYSVSTSMNADKADITCEDLYIDLGTIAKAISRLRPDKAWDLMSYQLNYLLKYRTRLLIPCYFSLKSHIANHLFPRTGSNRTSLRFLKRAVETPLKTIDELVLQAKYANFLRP